MVNEPFVEVELEGLPPGEYEVGLRTEVHSTRQQVSIDVARQALYFMHRDLADASRYPPSLERRFPAYILSVQPPVQDPEGLQLLRVRVDSESKGQGEAWYISS